MLQLVSGGSSFAAVGKVGPVAALSLCAYIHHSQVCLLSCDSNWVCNLNACTGGSQEVQANPLLEPPPWGERDGSQVYYGVTKKRLKHQETVPVLYRKLIISVITSLYS